MGNGGNGVCFVFVFVFSVFPMRMVRDTGSEGD